MKGVELYGQVRRAVYVEGLSRRRRRNRAAPTRCRQRARWRHRYSLSQGGIVRRRRPVDCLTLAGSNAIDAPASDEAREHRDLKICGALVRENRPKPVGEMQGDDPRTKQKRARIGLARFWPLEAFPGSSARDRKSAGSSQRLYEPRTRLCPTL
jgi:hypothetical protein